MSTELEWFKSSYSSGDGECLEAALQWTKSSHSADGECLEVAPAPGTIHIRDSKQAHATEDGPTFTVTAPAWTAFLAALG